MRYWFRPKRFWRWFALYVPTSLGGWVVTLFLLALAAAFFFLIDYRSHSASDTLINFAPYAVMFMLLFDLLCFRLGEYPSWWRKEQVRR